MRPFKVNYAVSQLVWRQNIHILIVALLVTGWWFIGTTACAASADPFLDGQMKVIEDKLTLWDKRSLLIACLTYAVAALGIIMAALQAVKSKWIKGGTAALAVMSALIVSFTHQFFPADDRAYQRAANQARNKLTAFRLELAQFHDPDEATTANLYQKFGQLIKDVGEIESSTIYNAISAANVAPAAQPSLGVSLLSTAWAGQNLAMLPGWANQLPADDRSFYFLGTGDGTTLDNAHQNSLAKARSAATDAVLRAAKGSASLTNKPQVVAELAKTLANSAEIAETFAAPQPSVGYRAYTLLRLSRSAAVFTAQSIFVRTGIPYDNHFLEEIFKSDKLKPVTDLTASFTVTEAVKHAGAADGSAGIAVGEDHFIGASDENNVLRLYSSDSPDTGKELLDLNPLLGFEKEDGEFKECDIEGAAQMDDVIFWIGSHGLNKKGHVKDSRRVLFATALSGSGADVQLTLKGAPCKTLMDAFMMIPELKSSAGIKPEEKGGLNIEALCANGGSLLIGFRNPVSDKGALIVPLTNPKEVIAGKPPVLGQPFRLNLEGRGIRDMTHWHGQFLIVAGDYKDRTEPDAKAPKLFRWSGDPKEAPVPMEGELGDLNPEAALAYGEKDKEKLQLLSDDGGESFRSVWVKMGGVH